MKNKSETLFEAYLRANGYFDFDYEKEIQGSAQRPDYTLRFNGAEILFEVKEFQATPGDFTPGFDYFDPYRPLREKIDAARQKFKRLKTYCCCLVLYNVNKPLVLMDWQHIYGAMLGNVGFSLPLDIPGCPKSPNRSILSIFMREGKMTRWLKGVIVGPQNRTISAILVLAARGETLI